MLPHASFGNCPYETGSGPVSDRTAPYGPGGATVNDGGGERILWIRYRRAHPLHASGRAVPISFTAHMVYELHFPWAGDPDLEADRGSGLCDSNEENP